VTTSLLQRSSLNIDPCSSTDHRFVDAVITVLDATFTSAIPNHLYRPSAKKPLTDDGASASFRIFPHPYFQDRMNSLSSET
jgi:hypothetical protein